MLEFGVLGPLTVHREGSPVRLGGSMPARVLAALLCSERRMAAGELAEVVWDGSPPATARETVKVYVHRLRRALGAGHVRHETGGYRLVIEPGRLDAEQFADLAGRARAAYRQRRLEPAADLYRRALATWRGEPYTDVLVGDPIRREAQRLSEQRLLAQEEQLAVGLDLGRHVELVADAGVLAQTHPDRERLQALLMLALYRAGRQAEALAAYRQTRVRLADELGIDPGELLQRLHGAMLRADPQLLEAAIGTLGNGWPPGDARPTGQPRQLPAQSRPEPGTPAVPRQLPADTPTFVGRGQQLQQLDTLLAGDGPASSVVISAIGGTAGAGKTALAVHWAHRVVARFPDGQLFLDLHGYTPVVTPVEPAATLERLLRALGVPGPRIPSGLEDRTGLWRTVLAGRRMLIVLDNAASEAQVAPLLPGAPGCLVLVTSRRRLAGLDAGQTLELDLLPPVDARDLFTRTAGRERLASEPPDLVTDVVERCGRLPLAIRIAAARLRSHPAWRLADLAARLCEQDRRLIELDDGSRSIAAALALSYQQFPAQQQRMYRLLGLHPGAEIDAYAAAALADTTVGQAGSCLDGLLQANLLTEPAAGRHVFHDLVRAHAADAAVRNESEPDRWEALTRLLDHYRYTASMAMDAAYSFERGRRPRVPATGTPTPAFAGPDPAVAWLDRELPNLLATARHAATDGWPDHACHLSATVHRHLHTRGHLTDAATLHEQTLATARSRNDRACERDALLCLGDVERLQSRYAPAIEHYREALELARITGSQDRELAALTGLGWVLHQQSRYEQALDHLERALQLARTTGNQLGELEALTGLGWLHHQQNRYEPTLDHLQQALRLARTTGNRANELYALIGIGSVYMRKEQHRQAQDHLQPALAIARATGNHAGEQDALAILGYTHLMVGRYPPAVAAFSRGLEVAQRTGNRVGELSARIGLGQAYRRQGQLERATHQYQLALEVALAVQHRNFQFEALHGLGRLRYATGDAAAAIDHHRRALAIATELRQPADQARAHDGLAAAYLALHQLELARRHWRRALDTLVQLGVNRTEDEETTPATIRAQLASLDNGR